MIPLTKYMKPQKINALNKVHEGFPPSHLLVNCSIGFCKKIWAYATEMDKNAFAWFCCGQILGLKKL